jgi:hypothetical protein
MKALLKMKKMFYTVTATKGNILYKQNKNREGFC